MKDLIVIKEQNIQNKIYPLRGLQVMLDKDLAELYDVKPTRLREQIKRNIERFPEDFMFQLTLNEVDYMVSQNAIPSKQHLGGSLPYVFTEQGVATISSVLTKKISKELQLDLQKHNAQYPSIKAIPFPYSHDRFLIIDKKEIYHLGASLKDLGKKWFAFSLLEINSLSFIDKIKDFA